MSEKIIDEVMGLIDDWAQKDFLAGVARIDPWTENAPNADPQILERLYDEASAARLAITSKLREVLERKPMQEGEIFNWWRGENGLEDHDMCKLQDFSEVVRAVEKRHNIK